MTASMRTSPSDGSSREIIRVLGACGEMPDAEIQHLVATPPDLPPFDECTDRGATLVESGVALRARLDARIHPEDTAFMRDETIDDARVRAWFAFADGRPIDTLSLLLAADAFPPPVFNIPFARGWVPTLEFTVHVRARPVGSRLACVFRTRVAQGGLLESDGELWDEAGQLVALSRQMAVAPRG
jgi:acyl-CoA thioesterase